VAGHVTGPQRLLRALAAGRLRRFAHLSTAYVCGRRSGTILESEGDVDQAFHNTYERVKLRGEAALRRAGARVGVDVRVFRPSIVGGAAPATAGGTFHLVVRDAPTQAELLTTLADRLGVRGVSLVDARSAPLTELSPLERTVARMLEGYRPYLTQHVRFDDSATRRVLADTGLAPAALSAEAVHALIDEALVGEDARKARRLLDAPEKRS